MAKKGMKRPERTHTQPRNQQEPVSEIEGMVKHTKEKTVPNDNGMAASGQMAFHRGRPIPSNVYPVIDTDLARDNVENDIPVADLSELS